MGTGKALPKNGELRYALVVAVDIEGFSKLGVLDQAGAQIRLSQMLEQAAAEAGLCRDDWYIQPRGDGELAVLPADTDVAWVVAKYPHLLAEALRRQRLDTSGRPKLRLRLAMHHGPLTAGRLGLVGHTPIIACRLLDAPPTKHVLAMDESADLVQVISRQLYEDVVLTRFHGLSAGPFRPMRAKIKGTTYWGYLCLGSSIGMTDARSNLEDQRILIVAD